MALVLGMNAKIYYNTSGSGGGGTWVEMGNVTDVTLNLERGEADVTTRSNNGWRATVGTLKDGSVEFEMIWDTTDAGFTAIKNAYFSDGTIGLTILDGDISSIGSQGLRGDFAITNLSRSEPLEEAVKASVTAKPTYSATPATWYTVGGS
jgi:predicted secreted protein